MPFILLLPIIAFGIIMTVLRSSAEQKRRANAQRETNVQPNQAAYEGQASYTPVKPSVQASPVRKETAALKAPTVKKEYQSSFKQPQKHPEHELCALRPEEPKQQDVHTDASALQNSEASLEFTPDQILKGVLFSEILGKPKSLR